MARVGRIRVGAVCEIITDLLLPHAHHTPGSVLSARPGCEMCTRRPPAVPEGRPAPGGGAGT